MDFTKDGDNGFTRRDFFKGSALTLTGIAAASVLPAEAQAPKADVEKTWSWSKKPAPIPAEEIKKKLDADVVIIGAGISGLCAAISAREAGATVTVVDKNPGFAARGAHITGFGTKLQKKMNVSSDYRQIVRELVRWAQGRANEDLLHLFAQKCGGSLDWLIDLVTAKGLSVNLWDDYYRGPDYQEYPVTHIFFDPKTGVAGNGALMPVIEAIAKEKGVNIMYKTPAVRLLRQGSGPVTGVIAGTEKNYVQLNAGKAVIIATGDYASNKEMTTRYSPICSLVDAQIYFPNKCNTGDAHIMAMHIGGAMQKVEPHAAAIHLEAGAMSYSFLHVNALGKRFKNEDVNTQSKSCGKLFQPERVAWTVYDADGLMQVQQQIESGIAGGIFYGQMMRMAGQKWSMEQEKKMLEEHIQSGKVVAANTLEELARKMNVPEAAFKATVERYNLLAQNKNDEDYGKRAELLNPIVKAPFYAGKLLATLLNMCGGLRTDPSLRVLDEEDKPIEHLYVVGSAQGDFFAADYPTICPGIGHGRCITFGRLAGLLAAGKTTDEVPSLKI